jgi:ribosomal-protein-alanine N-acetyltransferase
MAKVALLRLDPALAEALAKGCDHLESEYRLKLGSVTHLVREMVGAPSSGIDEGKPVSPWGGYLVIDEIERSVVGTCAFKGPPKAGTVEIAYFTFPGFEGRGYATAMASSLVEAATKSPEVKRITARTLRERSASTAVLERIGMRLAGDVIDPDDGAVWEWEWQHAA